MKAAILQENLSKALAAVSRSVASKPSVPVLGNMLFREVNGALELAATNLEVGVRMSLAGKVEKGFEITVPARQITELVSGMSSGQVELSVTEGRLTVSGAKFKAELAGISASEFPGIPVVSGDETIAIVKEKWVESLQKVLFAAANDEGRPVLTGVLIEFDSDGLVLVATDGYRLSKAVLKVQSSKFKVQELRILVPVRAMMELSRLCGENEEKEIGVWVTKEANQVIFKLGGVELVSRLIEGNFPDYGKIIPGAGTSKLWADKEELLRSVKLAAVFARESANIIKLRIDNSKLIISANSPQLGGDEAEVEIKKEGENVEMAFNYRYVVDFLNNFGGEEVVFETSGALSPGMFRIEGEEAWLHIIMPVRVQQ